MISVSKIILIIYFKTKKFRNKIVIKNSPFFEFIVLGVYSGGVTPDPISNSAVKTVCADGSHLW